MSAPFAPDAMPGWFELLRAGNPLVRFGASPERVASVAWGQVYLATPYTREVVGPRGWDRGLSLRMQAYAARAQLRLALVGVTAVSPIVQAAEMVQAAETEVGPGEGPDSLDPVFWTRWCAPMLAASSAVAVPEIPGWERSQGVWHEVHVALGRNLPVFVYARVSTCMAT